RALGQRRITRQCAIKGLRGQQTGQQTHRRTRVTQVERPRWRLQTVQADAVNGYPTMMRPLDNHPHVTKGLQGSQGIFTLEETLDFGSPLGKRAEHDRTVRDGLVARNPDTALDATTRLGKKDQIVVMHGVHIGPTGQDFTEMFTGYPGTGKHPEQVMTITLGNGFAQSIQVIAEGVQGAQYG